MLSTTVLIKFFFDEIVSIRRPGSNYQMTKRRRLEALLPESLLDLPISLS